MKIGDLVAIARTCAEAVDASPARRGPLAGPSAKSRTSPRATSPASWPR